MKKQDITFGIHAVEAVLKNSPERVIEMWVLQGRDDQRLTPLLAMAAEYGVSVQKASRKVLDDKASSGQHQGIIARVKAAKQLNDNDLLAMLDKTEQPFFIDTRWCHRPT